MDIGCGHFVSRSVTLDVTHLSSPPDVHHGQMSSENGRYSTSSVDVRWSRHLTRRLDRLPGPLEMFQKCHALSRSDFRSIFGLQRDFYRNPLITGFVTKIWSPSAPSELERWAAQHVSNRQPSVAYALWRLTCYYKSRREIVV